MKQIYNLTTVLFLLAFNFIKAQENAINFDGINDEILLTHFERPDVFTLEVWVKIDNSAASPEDIVAWATADTSTNNFTTELFITNGFVRYAEYNGTDFPLTSSADISDNNWHHIAVTRNNNSSDNVNFYLDGNLISTNTINIDVITDNLRLGAELYSNISQRHFQGSTDELRIWNFEKTITEIQDQMNLELSGSETGLLAYYNFNQGTANGDNSSITTLTDNSSNNINGTLNNFTLNSTTSNWIGGVEFSSLSVNSISDNNKTIFPFPNPATNFIQVAGMEAKESYKVYNILGSVLINGNISNQEKIDIRNLTNGLYFLKFENGNTIKFIKE